MDIKRMKTKDWVGKLVPVLGILIELICLYFILKESVCLTPISPGYFSAIIASLVMVFGLDSYKKSEIFKLKIELLRLLNDLRPYSQIPGTVTSQQRYYPSGDYFQKVVNNLSTMQLLIAIYGKITDVRLVQETAEEFRKGWYLRLNKANPHRHNVSDLRNVVEFPSSNPQGYDLSVEKCNDVEQMMLIYKKLEDSIISIKA